MFTYSPLSPLVCEESVQMGCVRRCGIPSESSWRTSTRHKPSRCTWPFQSELAQKQLSICVGIALRSRTSSTMVRYQPVKSTTYQSNRDLPGEQCALRGNFKAPFARAVEQQESEYDKSRVSQTSFTLIRNMHRF